MPAVVPQLKKQIGEADPRTGEGVIEPEVYDPVLNPLFRDLLKHHSVVALPARVGHPDRKGKVESGVGHAQKTPLKGLRFETIEEASKLVIDFLMHCEHSPGGGGVASTASAIFRSRWPPTAGDGSRRAWRKS